FRLTLPRRAGVVLVGSPLPLVPYGGDGASTSLDALPVAGQTAIPGLAGSPATDPARPADAASLAALSFDAAHPSAPDLESEPTPDLTDDEDFALADAAADHETR